jgi:hypothetical protein
MRKIILSIIAFLSFRNKDKEETTNVTDEKKLDVNSGDPFNGKKVISRDYCDELPDPKIQEFPDLSDDEFSQISKIKFVIKKHFSDKPFTSKEILSILNQDKGNTIKIKQVYRAIWKLNHQEFIEPYPLSSKTYFITDKLILWNNGEF